MEKKKVEELGNNEISVHIWKLTNKGYIWSYIFIYMGDKN